MASPSSKCYGKQVFASREDACRAIRRLRSRDIPGIEAILEWRCRECQCWHIGPESFEGNSHRHMSPDGSPERRHRKGKPRRWRYQARDKRKYLA